MKNIENELQKFRSRWLRWLGQKTRCDKPFWTTLLNCNWTGWVEQTLEAHGFKPPSKMYGRKNIKFWYSVAINEASMIELRRLDNLYCSEKIK